MECIGVGTVGAPTCPPNFWLGLVILFKAWTNLILLHASSIEVCCIKISRVELDTDWKCSQMASLSTKFSRGGMPPDPPRLNVHAVFAAFGGSAPTSR